MLCCFVHVVINDIEREIETPFCLACEIVYDQSWRVFVSCGYIVLQTQPVVKAMTNSILEFCDDVKHRKEDIVESTG